MMQSLSEWFGRLLAGLAFLGCLLLLAMMLIIVADVTLRNLAIQQLKEKAAAMGADSEEIAGIIMKAQAAQAADYGRYYGANGASAVLGRLSNPFAWAQLFESIKRGDFKRK